MASRPARVAGLIGLGVLRAAWVSLMVVTPLFGFWLASSLAAFSNASQWLALLVGLLLFPIVPVGWDLFFVWRRSKQPPVKAILTRLDRLVLRTLLVNGLFLAVMIWSAPTTSFRALAVRGDWIVDGHHGPIAERVRGFLLGIADLFEHRWRPSSNDYGNSDKPPPETDEDAPPRDPTAWPLSNEPDPIVTAMPESEQTSVEAVGRYLAARFPDQRMRVKALHDYVVLRMTYDTKTFELRGEEKRTKRPSQQAADVFAARTAVCEGYARLMVALGEAAGVEIAYVTGFVRTSERRIDDTASDQAIQDVLEGYRHAWNAAKIDGTWYLLDATWDDPVTKDGTQKLESTYLLTPPTLFRYDHLPAEPAWQLIAVPLSAGEFARQPLMSPASGKLGVTLEQPTRSQITVSDGSVRVVLDNPREASVIAEATPAGSDADGTRCETSHAGTKTTITCALGSGEYEVRMFGKPKTAGSSSYPYLGTILVNSR